MSDPGLMLVAELHGLVGRQSELRELLDALADGRARRAGLHELPRARRREARRVGAPGGLGSTRLPCAPTTPPPHYRRYRDAVGPLLARPSDVVVHRLDGTVHARDPNPPDPGMLG